jgi:uncharacterized protein YdaU (DUF1376 family)
VPLLLPFFKFYVLDWLTSEKVMQMSGPQVGSYIMLLAHCWAQATCTIPADRVTLYKLSKWEGTDDDFQPVLSCFTPFKKTGRLCNPRLYAEWSEAMQRTEVLSESGQKGALKRWAKKQPGVTRDRPTPVDWLTTIKANPAYKHLSIETELSKMDAWLSTKPGRKKTKSFVVNWLNKIETPFTSNGGKQRPPPPPPKNDPIGRGLWGKTYGKPEDHGYT